MKLFRQVLHDGQRGTKQSIFQVQEQHWFKLGDLTHAKASTILLGRPNKCLTTGYTACIHINYSINCFNS